MNYDYTHTLYYTPLLRLGNVISGNYNQINEYGIWSTNGALYFNEDGSMYLAYISGLSIKRIIGINRL